MAENAVQDFLAKWQDSDLPAFADEAQSELLDAAASVRWPPTGVPPGLAEPVRRLLVDHVPQAATTRLLGTFISAEDWADWLPPDEWGQRHLRLPQEPGHVRELLLQAGFPQSLIEPGLWSELFQVTHLDLEIRDAHDSGVNLYESRPLIRRQANVLAARVVSAFLSAVAHPHNGPTKWHLHPVFRGQQLGYRLFFDARRTQEDLAWEQHGSGGLRWGDPVHQPLSPAESAAVHQASLACIRKKKALAPRRMKFQQWAKNFDTPTAKARVAHPYTAVVKRW